MSFSLRAIATFLALAFSSSLAHAQATVPTAAPTSPFASMMQGLFGLVVVIGLILATAWVMRRVGPRAKSSGAVQVIGGASVGTREKVVVVRFEGRTLLLGVAPGHVGLLHACETGAAPNDPVVDPATPNFVDRLRAARGTSGSNA